MKSTRSSTLFLEQAESLPGLGLVLLVTVVAADAARAQLAIERHVFLPGLATCVNETSYPRDLPRAWRDVEAMARADTRVLAVEEAARHGVLLSPAVLARSVRLLDAVRGNPFAPLLEVSAIEQSLWEIQEWTASRELRGLLSRAVAGAVSCGV